MIKYSKFTLGFMSRSERAQASMETILLLGGILAAAILILVILLSIINGLQQATNPDISGVEDDLNMLG